MSNANNYLLKICLMTPCVGLLTNRVCVPSLVPCLILFHTSFAGIVVAKLPFIPFSLLQNISHRKLEGEDPTDCSVVRESKGVGRVSRQCWLVALFYAYERLA